MAEGGGKFGYEDPYLDHQIDHDDEDPDEDIDPNNYDVDDDQQSHNTTQPFQPGQASTPYHGGDQI